MNNKNVPTEDKALEIPNVLNTLESKLENLESYINTLEERLKSVSRPYKDQPDPEPISGTPLYYTNLGIRIDKSVTSVSNAIDRIGNILGYLEV